MAMATPGWQTDDLVEEWVESSPSPPPSTLPRPLATGSAKSTLPRNIGSIQAKRGSLRGLGHAPARGLPASRSNSMNQGKVLAKRDASGLLSPPSSGPEDELGPGPVGGAGTCVVKDGVDDDRGKHLIRNQAKGKDIFGALPLERMFVPPSPPVLPSSTSAPRPPSPPKETQTSSVPAPSPPASATSALSPVSLSSTTGETPVPRRVSHQYAPLQPSRLSKSITPSNVSSSFSSAPPEAVHPRDAQLDDSLLQDDTAPQVEQTTEIYALAQSTTPDTSPNRADQGVDVPQGEFSFVYERPSQAQANATLEGDSLDGDEVEELDGRQPTFDPSEISHSTVHGGRIQQPGLRLFRSTYDTYTREHLSALVDSIAIEQSPSQGSSGGSREETPGTAEHDSAEGSGSADARSSKRLRLSPPSPPKRTAMRDWGAQGMRMMDKIRDIGPGSTTSASRSRTSDEDQRTGESLRPQTQSLNPDLADLDPTIDYRQSPSMSKSPTPDPPVPSKIDRPTHRSNPSTTSSGYLRAAEDLMARIKNRGVSESGSNPDSPASRMRQILSETDDNAFASSEADTDGTSDKAQGPNKPKSRTGPSPRRILRRLSASEEIKRVTEGGSDSESGDDLRAVSSQKQAALNARRAQQDSLANGAPAQIQHRRGFDADDLNRYVSSSTHPTATNTGTTISTSFVKHKGRPPAPPPANIRMIRPDDVQGMLANRVGKMRYDQNTMRWVRELDTVDENGESRRESEESEDVFAGMESWRDEVRSLRQDLEDETDVDGVQDEVPVHDGDMTSRQIFPDDMDEVTDEASSPEQPPAPRLFPNPPSISPPARPVPHHAASAPPILTPRPGSSSPPKLRSALRQPNSSTPFHNGQKKRAGWHSDLTPAPARGFSQTPGGSSGARRSVSFSDGKKTGKIDAPEVMVPEAKTGLPADDFFKSREGGRGQSQNQAEQSAEISWMPSVRTKRIQGMLEDMEDLSKSSGDRRAPQLNG